jgi:DUF3047 family protein
MTLALKTSRLIRASFNKNVTLASHFAHRLELIMSGSREIDMWSNIRRSGRCKFKIAAITCVCVLLAGLLSHSLLLAGAQREEDAIVLDNFDQHGAGKFPKKWAGASNDAQGIYRIEAEADNHFLRARADNKAVQIGLDYVFNPKKLQQLKWRWRVRALPTGANEKLAEKHDAAAQVYVIFDSQYWPRIIKFTWSTSLPPGSRFTNPLYDRGRVVVLRSGAADPATWFEEKVNFYAEYKKFFGNEPGQVQGIGILTSSDSTKSSAIADYDDFVLLP